MFRPFLLVHVMTTGERRIYQLSFWIAALIIAGVFLSGAYKLFHPLEFARAVYAFKLLPDPLVKPVAYVIPWLEVICAVCLLLIPKLRTAALWLAIGLLVVFTLAMVIVLLNGTEVSCGCFSYTADEEPVSWMNVARNAALIALAGLGLLARKRVTAQ